MKKSVKRWPCFVAMLNRWSAYVACLLFCAMLLGEVAGQEPAATSEAFNKDKTLPIEKHGREHQPESFSDWLAGDGVKGELTYGETDHMGYNVINGKVHIHDLHATMLQLLGGEHTELTWNHLGRDFGLTDVHSSVVKEILV